MRAFVKVLPILIAALLLAAGCGGEDEPEASTTTSEISGASGATGAAGDAEEAESGSSALSTEDEAAIEDTIKTWLTEGGCDLMTDKFLENQTFIEDPAEACETFEGSFSEPLYGPDEVIVSEIEGDGEKATAVVGDEVSNVESEYKLVNEDGQWKIDSAGF
jgi:hypothetical protein